MSNLLLLSPLKKCRCLQNFKTKVYFMLILYYLLKLKNRLNARLTVINIQWESFQHIPDTSNTSNVVIGILTIR